MLARRTDGTSDQRVAFRSRDHSATGLGAPAHRPQRCPGRSPSSDGASLTRKETSRREARECISFTLQELAEKPNQEVPRRIECSASQPWINSDSRPRPGSMSCDTFASPSGLMVDLTGETNHRFGSYHGFAMGFAMDFTLEVCVWGGPSHQPLRRGPFRAARRGLRRLRT